LQRFFVHLGSCWAVTRDEELEPIGVRIKDGRYRVTLSPPSFLN